MIKFQLLLFLFMAMFPPAPVSSETAVPGHFVPPASTGMVNRQGCDPADVLTALDIYIPVLHDRLHAIPRTDEKNLFDNLASLRRQVDRDTIKRGLPPVTGLALFSDTGDWLAWTDTIDDLPFEWMEYAVSSKPGSGMAVLYDTPGRVLLVHLTKSNYRIAMSQVMLIDRPIYGQNPDIITLRRDGATCVFAYQSPFERLPGVFPLDINLRESVCATFLEAVETGPEEHVLLGWGSIPDGIKKLFDPQFFAGDFLGLRSAGLLLAAGLVLWIVTHYLVPFHARGFRKGILFVIFAGSIVMTSSLVLRLTHTLTTDTASAWWPDFLGDYGLSSLALPLSALLLTGAWIRWLIFLGLSLFHTDDGMFRAGRRVPGWLCQAVAIALLSPLLIGKTGEIMRQTITDRLQNWIYEREYLLPLALETNLEKLSADPALRALLSDSSPLDIGPALHLWRTSDLHVFETDFAVQVLDGEGAVLDQFSPFFLPDTLHPDTLYQALPATSSRLIIPPRLQYQSTHSPLIGISAIETDNGVSGFLVIQIASDPGSIQPPPNQWGNDFMVYVTRSGDSSDINTDMPVVPKTEWFDNPPVDPQWTTDDSNRFQVLLYRLPYSDASQPEIIIGLLPATPFVAQLAGIARLALLAMCVLIPGLIHREILHVIQARSGKTYGSFTRQLLGAFLLPVIILPLVFAITLHRVINDTETEFQNAKMNQVLQFSVVQLKARLLERAKQLQTEIEQRYTGRSETDVPDMADLPWLVMDEFGQEALSGSLPMEYDLPLASITRVFQETHFRGRTAAELVFQSRGPGDLTAHAILPFPQSVPVDLETDFMGTFVCEIPVTSDFVRPIGDPSEAFVDIYANGSITASNRPEMFNTGLIPNRLDASVYRLLTHEKRDILLRMDRVHRQFSVTGALHSEIGQTIGALTISFRQLPFGTSQLKIHEWLFPATLFLLLSGIIFSLFFGRRIAKPVQALTGSAREVTKGNFNQDVPESGVGEIRLLTRTFNDMMHELEKQRINLQERHAFISALLARMSSAILAVDDTGALLTWNEAFRKLFLLSGDEFRDRTIEQVLSITGIPELKDAYNGYVSRRAGDRHIIRFFREGRLYHIAVTFARLESTGGQTGILIVLDDFTDTIRSSKLQAYTDLARRIAHEVKNPLTPIQLSIEHLRQAWDDGVADFPEVFNQCIAMVLEEVRSLEHISSEFSRFARFPKPSFRLEDIRELITEVAAMYPAQSKRIAIRTELPDYPLRCRFDRDQMKRVLINLIQNAIQAMDNGGDLTLRGYRDDAWITLEIIDTGSGMDDETLMNLFEPYFSTKKEGTGLGLVITKAVIDAHDGLINVSSAPGKGACFTIRLAAAADGDSGVNNIGGDHGEPDDTGH
jgi:PAS domain S-box-containing protein